MIPMTKLYSLSLKSQFDLQDIWRYIAQDNPLAADRVEAELYTEFERLACNPNIGHWREDITKKKVRFWSLYSYQIIYDPSSESLNILRILSGYRDFAKIMEDL